MFIQHWFKKLIRRSGTLLFGKKPRIHRIPFGPLKGQNIYMSFDISPRMFFGVDEPWVAQLIQAYVKPDDVIYDIGAHIGYTCLLFAQRLKGSGVVYAFEIIPSVVDNYLRKTLQANGFTNVLVHNIGLAATTKNLRLSIGATAMTSIYSTRQAYGERTEQCQTISLDEYVVQKNLPPPSLIKIDIEEAEIDCLLGAKNLITKFSPLMIIEFHSLDLLKSGFSFLSLLGYILCLQNGHSVDHKMLTDAKKFHASVLCLPRL